MIPEAGIMACTSTMSPLSIIQFYVAKTMSSSECTVLGGRFDAEI